MLGILAVGMLCGGGELARRHFLTVKEPEPPDWPWFPGAMNHFETTFVNMDDVAKGINPPRKRTVSYLNPKQKAVRPKPEPRPVTKIVRKMTLIPQSRSDAKPPLDGP